MADELSLSDDKIFYTIEGEGEYIGQPSVFMRMAMCNLTCKGFTSTDSPHGCDSYVSWSVKNRMTFDQVAEHLDKYAKHLAAGAIWKLTGGEPLLQQARLLKFVEFYTGTSLSGFIPRIDFETNATILPDERWANEINATFTTSPKLESNGDDESLRYKPEVLRYHASIDSGFKFVVQSEEDLDEVHEKYVRKFEIPRRRVWLMPACGSRDEHIETSSVVADWAKERDYNFSPRLQLVIWDKALKV